MKQKQIILRSVARGSRDVFLGPAARPRGDEPAAVKVEVEDLDRRRRSELARHQDVLAVAPSMPMKLIEPVGGTAQPSAAGIAWGVSAVGADTSALTGDGIVVAVLDTGIDGTHPAFSGVTITEKDLPAKATGTSTATARTARARFSAVTSTTRGSGSRPV